MKVNWTAVLGGLIVILLPFIAQLIQTGGVQFTGQWQVMGALIAGFITVLTPSLKKLIEGGESGGWKALGITLLVALLTYASNVFTGSGGVVLTGPWLQFASAIAGIIAIITPLIVSLEQPPAPAPAAPSS